MEVVVKTRKCVRCKWLTWVGAFLGVACFVVPPIVFFAVELDTPYPMLTFDVSSMLPWVFAYMGVCVATQFVPRTQWVLGLLEKLQEMQANSFLATLYLNLVFALYAGVAARTQKHPWFLGVIAGYFLVFKLTFDVTKVGDIDFACVNKNHSAKRWVLLLICVCAILALTGMVLFKIHQSSVDAFAVATSVFFTLVLFLMVLIIMYYRDRFHIHHYAWPIPFIHLVAFDGTLFLLLQAAAIAVHLHGMAFYGPEIMFGLKKPKAPLQSSASSRTSLRYDPNASKRFMTQGLEQEGSMREPPLFGQ